MQGPHVRLSPGEHAVHPDPLLTSQVETRVEPIEQLAPRVAIGRGTEGRAAGQKPEMPGLPHRLVERDAGGDAAEAASSRASTASRRGRSRAQVMARSRARAHRTRRPR